MPAQLTSTSSGGTACHQRIDRGVVAHVEHVECQLRKLVAAVAASTSAGEAPVASTCAPSAAKRSAIARPMPLVAPTTMTRRVPVMRAP